MILVQDSVPDLLLVLETIAPFGWFRVERRDYRLPGAENMEGCYTVEIWGNLMTKPCLEIEDALNAGIDLCGDVR